ncbi:MAG: cytochrome c biogenesis protein CcsA [Pirellulales bacterium]|nr:cytochrome c biogenesis protein CcsA [Pirellulales bacterium]
MNAIRRIVCRVQTVLAAWAVLSMVAATGAAAEEPARLDLSAWQTLPVFYVEDGAASGRIMPLDTLARELAETICHKQSPTLGLVDAVPADELALPKYDAARGLFVDGKPRRFSAAELLLSWLTQPESWEDVPLLMAKHVELRELLGLPLADPKTKVKFQYASPRQVAQATAFWDKVAQLVERQRQAAMDNEPFKLTGVDARVEELHKAYRQYRLLTTSPERPLERLEFSRLRMRRLVESWGELRGDEVMNILGGTHQGFGDTKVPEHVATIDAAFEELFKLTQQGAFTAAQAEPAAVRLRNAAAAILEVIHRQAELVRSKPSPDWDPEQVKKLQTMFVTAQARAQKMAEQAQRAHLSLYDDGCPLGVVPALSGPALEKDRDAADDAQPWINLPTLLGGTDAVLAGYPNAEIQYPSGQVAAVRTAYARLADAYRQWRTRPNDVHQAADQFSSALADLGAQVEPLRRQLSIVGRDEDLFAYTAYPAPGATAAEVRYNTVQPFLGSWVIALLSVACFALSFGAWRKPLFWLGTVVMIGALAWTAYGFYLRILITGWAPVTNMYETVVYVPFVVAVLGLWFAFVPATWEGLKNAWRGCAIPGTWEATPLEREQTRLAGTGFWQMCNVLCILPRVALMAVVFWILTRAPYAAGGRTILNLLPNRAVGEWLPSFNDLLTWSAGMFVLVPTVWFLPRALVTAALSLGMVPWTLRGHFATALAEIYPRRMFVMSSALLAAVLWMVAWYAPVLDPRFTPLQPVLRDNFWLTIHVLTIVSSYGAGLLAFGLAMAAMGHYMFGAWQPVSGSSQLRPPQAAAELAGYVYKAIQVAVLLLAAGTLLGGLWADVSWGRFWGWDPKEVWALISLLTYLAILHGRFAGWFGAFGLHLGAVLGATVIGMSWYGVNFILGEGLHAYGFGDGGQSYVIGAICAAWLFWVAPAAFVYSMRTQEKQPLGTEDGLGTGAQASTGLTAGLKS